MFQFPGFAFKPYEFKLEYRSKAVGFPIRKSPDQRLFAGYPKLIAGYYVLHRLLSPRHPPCALTQLDHITPKGTRAPTWGKRD
jgi:hypothetical protein